MTDDPRAYFAALAAERRLANADACDRIADALDGRADSHGNTPTQFRRVAQQLRATEYAEGAEMHAENGDRGPPRGGMMVDIRTEGTPNGARITIEIGTAELNAVPDYGLGFENIANLAALAVLGGYISSLGLDPAQMLTAWGELTTEEES